MRQTPPKKADKSQRVLTYLSLPAVGPPAGILEDWQQRLVRLEHGVQTDEEDKIWNWKIHKYGLVKKYSSLNVRTTKDPKV